MELQIELDTYRKIENISNQNGLDLYQVVDKAITYYKAYLDAVKELETELNELDSLSDESLTEFENSL